MLTIALGILSAVVLLFGFGFISTASLGWFFHAGNHTLPSPHQTGIRSVTKQK